MRSLLNIFTLFTILLFLNSCGNSNLQAQQDVVEDSTELASSENIEVEVIEESIFIEDIGEREPTDDEIREFGIISNIEDGIYPMFIVTIEFPEREFQMDFNLNMEYANIDPKSIDLLIGKYASFYYTSELENRLIDMHFQGKSLMGDYAPEVSDNWKKVNGVLSGAESPTISDLPGSISITDKSGEVFEFEYYVDEMMVKANGQEVNAFYTLRGVEDITYLRVSEY
ncbi:MULTISPECIES: hypothetical protein [unclassified Lentimicrobium]|uniref:hypothetical protein n=1 Tax=unclassified Lentimicrobium TaxID=2677434 RepID=UPI001552980F|nr:MULTISPECIES: hypothetical protein [unclassified Lentimicrobium]NPD44400.1 hypothetical protein [Lentimicrobium sp. S6]NPD84334.1 hypothetical protein [Lentimicrobium sp. L6]